MTSHFHLIDRPSKANIEEALTQLAYISNSSFITDWGDGSVRLRRGKVHLTPGLTKKQMAIFITGLFAAVKINQYMD